MFKTFEEVPAPIKPFYQEVTKSEPLLDEEGNQVFEPVEQESTDMDGNPVTVTVQKPVFHDVIYIELKGKTEVKSMKDVHRVIKLHKGKRDDVVKLFLSMVNTGIEWQFHDDYLEWFNNGETLQLQLKELQAQQLTKPTDDNTETQQDQIEQLQETIKQHADNEPQASVIITPDVWFMQNYDELRDAAYPSKEEQMKLQFNDMMDGTETWKDAIFAVRDQYPAPTKPAH